MVNGEIIGLLTKPLLLIKGKYRYMIEVYVTLVSRIGLFISSVARCSQLWGGRARGRTDVRPDGRMDTPTDGRPDGRTVTDGRTDGRTNGNILC